VKALVQLLAHHCLTILSLDYLNTHLVELMEKRCLIRNVVEIGALNGMCRNVSLLVFNPFTSEFDHGVMNRVAADHLDNLLVLFVGTHRLSPLGCVVK